MGSESESESGMLRFAELWSILINMASNPLY